MNRQKKSEYLRLLDMIRMQFGESCHVALYDLTRPNGEIVGLHGNMTDEEIGGPVPGYIMNILEREGSDVRNRYGFINKHMNGHVLRTSLNFIRDQGRVVGCFCINHNVVQIKMIVSFLEELSQSNNLIDGDYETIELREEQGLGQSGLITDTVQDFVEKTVEEFLWERVGLRNFPSLEKKEKLALIKELDEKGIFSVKGSVSMIAKVVGVSKFSIYSYLEEIRTAH